MYIHAHLATQQYVVIACSFHAVYLTIMSVSIYGDTVNICSVCVTC